MEKFQPIPVEFTGENNTANNRLRGRARIWLGLGVILAFAAGYVSVTPPDKKTASLVATTTATSTAKTVPTATAIPTVIPDLPQIGIPLVEVACKDNQPQLMRISGQIEFTGSMSSIFLVLDEVSTGKLVIFDEIKPDKDRLAKYRIELEGSVTALSGDRGRIEDSITFQENEPYRLLLVTRDPEDPTDLTLKTPTYTVVQDTPQFPFNCDKSVPNNPIKPNIPNVPAIVPKGSGNVSLRGDHSLPSGNYLVY